jgi:hypothetical protein
LTVDSGMWYGTDNGLRREHKTLTVDYVTRHYVRMSSDSAPKPGRLSIFRRSHPRPVVVPGDTVHAPEFAHFQPYDSTARILGDLRLRVTAVPVGRSPVREGFQLLRGYVVDADGFEAVAESWHYVRLASCRVSMPPGDHP